MKYKINLKGKTYEIEVEHGEAMLLAEYETLVPEISAAKPTPAPVQPEVSAVKIPASTPEAEGLRITAPLPGNILSIKISPGQKVKSGDVLMVIESMKMENEILAPSDGLVKQIAVNKDAIVATGDLLAVI